MLIELLNIVLNNLNSLNLEDVEEANKHIQKSSLGVFSPLFEDSLKFYKREKRFPEFSYLASVNPGLSSSLKKVDSSLSIDLFKTFLFELKISTLSARAEKLINDGEHDKALNILEKISELKEANDDEDIGYVPNTFDVYNFREAFTKNFYLGVPEIDNVLRGCPAATATVISAPPACGKTLLSLSAAYHNTFTLGANGAIIGLELEDFQMKFRTISRHSLELANFSGFKAIPYGALENKLLSEEEKNILAKVEENYFDPNGWEGYFPDRKKGFLKYWSRSKFVDFSKREISEKLFKLNSYIKDQYRNSKEFIRRVKEGEKEEVILQKVGLDYLIIDYAQLVPINFTPNNVNRVHFADEIFNHIMNLAKMFDKGRGFSLILLGQMNRSAQNELNEFGFVEGLTGISDYNILDRIAHNVVFLHTNESLKNSNRIKAQVNKNRSGPTTSMKTFYSNYAYCSIGDMGFNTVPSGLLSPNTLNSFVNSSVTIDNEVIDVEDLLS